MNVNITEKNEKNHNLITLYNVSFENLTSEKVIELELALANNGSRHTEEMYAHLRMHPVMLKVIANEK